MFEFGVKMQLKVTTSDKDNTKKQSDQNCESCQKKRWMAKAVAAPITDPPGL